MGQQIYGDGINVAARLESLAEPGGICISGTVHEQIGNKLALSYEDLGEQAVKNIAQPVRVFRRVAGARGFRSRSQRKERKAAAGCDICDEAHSRLQGWQSSSRTVMLVQHLSLRLPATSASIPPAQSQALPLPDKPSIVVLPFTNMSGDREQEYFSDGITD